jgi:hypothetical protein
VGSKQHGRKDARPHHAKDAAGEEHRTGSIRICARSPQAEVQVTISISIHAESQNYPDYNWHARPLKALIINYARLETDNEHMEGDGQTVFAHACKLGLEGIVSKRKDSVYRSGRSPDWIKMKNADAPAVKREAEGDWGKGRWR